jgi:hypothetical protein
MSETSNDIAQPGLGAETLAADDTRMAAPSGTDIERGAAPAQWAPSELHHPDKQAQPESAGAFGLAKAADALGLPPETIAGARAWIEGEASFTDEQLAAFDTEHETAAITELRGLWGDKFLANFKAIDAYLESLPGHAGAVFKQARDANGRALANDPASLQRVLGAAQSRGTVALAGSLSEQIAAVEAFMRNDRPAYNKDTLLQKRYLELLTMRERAQ